MDQEKRFAETLYCISNGGKIAALLSLGADPMAQEYRAPFGLDGDPRTSTDIMNWIGYNMENGAPGRKDREEHFWLPENSTFDTYCQDIFVPRGVVEELRVVFEKGPGRRKSGSRAWIATKHGDEFVRPIAAFTGQYMISSKRAISKVLGSVSSRRETRGPYNRVRALEYLREARRLKTNVRERDLSEFLNLDETGVLKHIRALEDLGFLGYYSASPEQTGWSRHGWVKGKDPADVGGDISRRVSNRLHEFGEASYRRLAEELDEPVGKVLGALTRLKKRGYVESTGWTAGGTRSALYILEEGLKFLRESDKTRSALGGGGELDGMQELLRELETDPGKRQEYISALMGLFGEASWMRDVRTEREIRDEIVGYVGEHPGCRTKELVAYLGPVFKELGKLWNGEGKLRRERYGPAVRYWLR